MISIKAIVSTLLTLGFLIVMGVILLGISDPTGLTRLVGLMFIVVAIVSLLIWLLSYLKKLK